MPLEGPLGVSLAAAVGVSEVSLLGPAALPEESWAPSERE